MIMNNVIRFSCYVFFNVSTCKCLQRVICQVVPRYVAVEFLHVYETLGPRPIQVESGMDVLTTR